MFHLIFDTETTGLPKSYSAPLTDSDNWPRLVQLSWIFSDGHDRQEFDYIIKPNGFEIPESATAIHGISNALANEKGFDLNFVLTMFRAYVNVADVVVGHNIDFDKNIVGSEYAKYGLADAFIKRFNEKKQFCTMKESTNIAKIPSANGKGNKWPKLSELYQFLFKENFDGAHNSLMDTRACACCYFELTKNL